MILDIVKGFSPWILYFILVGNTYQQHSVATIAAMTAFIIFDRHDLKKGFILSWGTFIFFLFMLLMVVILNNEWVSSHAWIFSNSTLALIAWSSILIGKPFTVQYARERVAKDKWNHPIFIKINIILTTAWALVFTWSALLHVFKLYYAAIPNWVVEATTDLSSVAAIAFTAWFPDWYKKRKSTKS